MERANRKPGIFERIRSMDLTSGNLFWKLGLFALPMALATILQLLYTTVDLVSVHLWGGGENSASAISGNGALINLVVVMFSGLAIVTMACVLHGDNKPEAKRGLEAMNVED